MSIRESFVYNKGLPSGILNKIQIFSLITGKGNHGTFRQPS